MDKILIIGATGFVGSYLVEEAWDRGLAVHITSRESSSLKYLQSIPLVNHRMNIFDEDALLDLIKKYKFEYIVQNAGIIRGEEEDEFYRVNASFIGKLCKLIKESGHLPTKLLYVSSLSAFGPADLDPRGIVSEDTFPRPLTLYGKSKLQGEQLLTQHNQIPHNIVRPTAIYGPRDIAFLPLYKMINKGYQLYPGGKDQSISLIHAKDMAKATFEILLYAPALTHYFLANKESITAKEHQDLISRLLVKNTIEYHLPNSFLNLAARLNQIIGSMMRKDFMFTPEKVKELSAKSWSVDVSALQILDFKYEYTLEHGIAETLNWCKKQKFL